jgi:hypothetical protein
MVVGQVAGFPSTLGLSSGVHQRPSSVATGYSMKIQPDFRPLGCAECARGIDLGFDFTMAFQPIVNIQTREIVTHYQQLCHPHR